MAQPRTPRAQRGGPLRKVARTSPGQNPTRDPGHELPQAFTNPKATVGGGHGSRQNGRRA
eukprot:15229141-Alexandrium_andersonii.AAC.1